MQSLPRFNARLPESPRNPPVVPRNPPEAPVKVATRGLAVLVGTAARRRRYHRYRRGRTDPRRSSGTATRPTAVTAATRTLQQVSTPAWRCAAPISGSLRGPRVTPQAINPLATPSGYGPTSLQSAYNLPSTSAGAGQRVYIVDAYDDPNAESDLAAYRTQFGLAPCTTANGCFQKLNQTGATEPAARRRTPGGPARSRSTSTWSRRSARTAASR